MISQKGLAGMVSGNFARIEAGTREITSDRVLPIVVTLNSLISVVIEQAADLQAKEIAGYQFASVGASVQGSWNNAVGTAGDSAIRTVLAKHLTAELAQIVWKDGTTAEFSTDDLAALIDHIADAKVFRLRNGYHLRFASEPDVSLRDPQDRPVLAIEVKAGTDAAGALERLGAAMKSFENDKALNPRVKTVYVVQSLTPEVQKRINQQYRVDYTFGLGEILSDDDTQRKFANLIVAAMMKSDGGELATSPPDNQSTSHTKA